MCETLAVLGEAGSPENKFGFDAKWDVEIGIWVEASYSFLTEPVGLYKNQLFATLGMDYTFGLGNGLNVIMEHLVYNFSEQPFAFKAPGHFTASILSYPLGLDDQINSVLYYNWEQENFSFFMNYQHRFSRVTAYLMAFYIPEGQASLQQSNWVTPFTGPGIRVMVVYDH